MQPINYFAFIFTNNNPSSFLHYNLQTTTPGFLRVLEKLNIYIHIHRHIFHKYNNL